MSKQLLKPTFRGRKIDRPLFIPFVGDYLTKVNQSSLQDIYQDAGLLHQSLRDTQQLIGYDAVVLPIDPTLEAEAFGCELEWNDKVEPVVGDHLSKDEVLSITPDQWLQQGRIPVFLEAAKRFSQVEGKTIPIFASISGPLTIIHQLYGEFSKGQMDDIVQCLIALSQAYADAGVNGIIINEGDLKTDVDLLSFVGYYKPIFNVIRHYNIYSILRLPTHQEGVDLDSNGLKVDGVVGPIDNDLGLNKKNVFGIPLTTENLIEPIESFPIIEKVKEASCKKVFLTTEKPLNVEDVELDSLKDRVEKLCSNSFWE